MTAPPIPAPSAMRWQDVIKIHCGDPLDVEPILPQLDDCIDTVSDSFMVGLQLIQHKFEHHSEMDAMARVFFTLVEATKRLNVKVSTRANHKCVTDILVISRDEVPLSFIEVKSFSSYPSFDTATNTLLQVLRKAHILLCEEQSDVPELTCIATNSRIWSFGQVSRLLHCSRPQWLQAGWILP